MRQALYLTRHGPRSQRGTSGVEFALLFPIFFGVFYAILSYAFITLLYQGLTQAAADGARAAIQVNPTAFATQASYETAVKTLASNAAQQALSWLPQTVRDKIAAGGVTYAFANATTTVATSTGNAVVVTQSITVKVTYPSYNNNPILPLLDLPLVGKIPDVPNALVGSSTLRVTPTLILTPAPP